MVDDIYDIWTVPWWQTPQCIIMVGMILCIVLIMVVYRRRPRPKLLLSPVDQAYNALMMQFTHTGALRPDTSQKAVYQVMTHAIRCLFSLRFGYEFEALSDEELIAYVEHHREVVPLPAELIAILERSSTVKFAGERVQDDEIIGDRELVLRLRGAFPLDTSGKLRDTNNTL